MYIWYNIEPEWEDFQWHLYGMDNMNGDMSFYCYDYDLQTYVTIKTLTGGRDTDVINITAEDCVSSSPLKLKIYKKGTDELSQEQYQMYEEWISFKNSSDCPPDNLCNGTIYANSQYSDSSPINGSYVYLNSVLNGTTNTAGQHQIKFYNVECGTDETVSVYCHNNQSKLCQTKSESIDFNGDEDSLFFNCDVCRADEYSNLEVDINDVSVSSNGANYDINVVVHSTNINANNLNVTVKAQSKSTGLIEREGSDLIDVSGVGDFNASITMNLGGIDYLHVYVDPNNQIAEDKSDNYVLVPVVKKKLKANLSVNTGYSKVDDAIRDYLRFFVDDVGYNEANIILNIGTKTSDVATYSPITLAKKSNSWGWDKSASKVKVNGNYLEMDYSGFVYSYLPSNSKQRIFVYGNRIEGTIAALKELIAARDMFFFNYGNSMQAFGFENKIILDKYDVSAIAVFDLFHNDENKNYFGKNTDEFADVVYDILNDNNFEISIKTVKTTNDNTTLRMKHVNSDYSTNFKDAIINQSKPVVMSMGIHSNLFSWNDFAEEIAQDPEDARDTWLIEMVGGPTIDEDCETYSCPNYTFTDLKTYYWPALIAGVENYSGQNTIDYVGYSLGCSAALESLELYQSSGKNNAGIALIMTQENMILIVI